MKMKEVITETGLTDRAIRLYIENGLVAPSCSENYAGRKNIEFTAEDVAKLNNIATLRKAGFSIGEIKLMGSGKAPCRKALEEFMTKTSERIESDKAVLEKLETVILSEDVSIESICESLNSITVEKAMPESDIKLSLAEKIEKYFFLAVSVAGFIWLAIAFVLQIFILIAREMKFIVPETEFYIKWITLIYIVSVSVFLLYNYKINRKATPSKKRAIISIILCVLLIPVGFASYIFNFLSLIDTDIRSETHNLKNYLVIDNNLDAFRDDINEFFPSELSATAKTFDIMGKSIFTFKEYNEDAQYFYRHQLVIDNDRDLTIYLQRTLDDKELEAEIQKYINLKPLESVSVSTKKINNWTLIYYCEKGETAEDFYGGYMYKIFAYNKYGRVRYILEYNAGSPVGLYTVPYHMDLQW